MKKMFAPERRNIILDKLTDQGRITIKELSKVIDVSEATLRTDLSKMEEEGLLIRTHGGAMLATKQIAKQAFSSGNRKIDLKKRKSHKKLYNFSLADNVLCSMQVRLHWNWLDY